MQCWTQIVARLVRGEGPLTIAKSDIAPPDACSCFESAIGLPQGEDRDWRIELDGCQRVHVREYADRYEAHLDQFSPSCAPVRHLLVDAPAVAGVVGMLIGGAVGAAAGNALAGASVGSMVAGAGSLLLRRRA